MSEAAESVDNSVSSEPTNTETTENATVHSINERTDRPAEKADKPAGYYPVDPTTASPEEVNQRFNYMFKQIKDAERRDAEWRRTDAERQRVILELQSGVGQIAEHLTQKTFSDNEAQLEARMQSALETGDTKTYLAMQNKLIDLKTEQRLAAKQKETAKAAPPRTQNFNQIANDAYQGGEISYEDNNYAQGWMNERDERGQALRPWANNPSNDPMNPDPDYVKALFITKNVFNGMPHLTMQQKLNEIDKRMGIQKNTASQSVMGTNLTRGSKSAKVSLTPKQEEIAVRTKFAGPKASNSEHLEAFRKAILKQRGEK